MGNLTAIRWFRRNPTPPYAPPTMARGVRDVQRRFGQRVQSLRKERGWSQETLGARCRISQKYLSEIERGAKAPSFETLVVLAQRGFRIRLSTLLYGVDEDAPGITRLEDLLAGRSGHARQQILRALAQLLDAGAAST